MFPNKSGTVALEGELNSILDDLENVDTTVKADKQVLTWDAAHSTGGAWIAADVVTLDELSADVDSTIVSGQPANLEYDNTSGLFTLTLGDYVMTTGDTMSGDLTLDGADLVFDKTSYTVTLAAGGSAGSSDVDLILPDESGTLVTSADVDDMIANITVVPQTPAETGNGSLLANGYSLDYTPVNMDNYIRYDGTPSSNVTGSLTFSDNTELRFGQDSGADLVFYHSGTIGKANTDTSFEFSLTAVDTYFAVQKNNTDNNIIKALDVAGTSGEVILGANGYNTVLTFANPNGNVTIDAGDRDSASDDITITIPNHSGRDGDSSYHAPEFMLTTSLLEELHDVDITGRIQGSFLIWNTASQRWVMNDSESGFIPLAGTESGGEVTGQIEFDGGHIYINDSDDLGATNSIVFGTGSDAAIYHDSTNTIFNNQTGELQIESDTLRLTSASSGGETYFLANKDAGVELYYDDTKKIETDANGVTVIGNVNLSEDNANITIGGSNELTVTQSPTVGSITSTGSSAFTVQSSNSDLILQGNTKVNVTSDLTSSGAITFTGFTNNTLGSLDGAVVISGGASIARNLTVSGGTHIDGELRLNNDTESNASNTGALIVDGGVGIAKNLNVGGDVVLGTDADNTVTFNSDVNSDILPETTLTHSLGSNTQRWQSIYVSEIISGDDAGGAAGGVTMGNVTIANGNLNTISTREGNLIIDSHNTTGGTITMQDDVIVTGTFHVNGQSTLASVNVQDLTDNRIVIVGSSGELEDDDKFRFDGNDLDIGVANSETFTVKVSNGNTAIAGTLDVGGVFHIKATDGSNAPNNGALRVDGGVGIAENLNVGGKATVDYSLVVDNTSLTGPNAEDGVMTIQGNGFASTTDITIKSGAGHTGGNDITIDARTTTITGNLTVSGDVTTVNTEEINLADNVILLNSNFTSGTPTQAAGLDVLRGDEATVSWHWDETNTYWTPTGYVGGDSTDNTRNKIHADIFEGMLDGIVYATDETTTIFNPGTNGSDAWARSDIHADGGQVVLENGTNDTLAWFKGDIKDQDDNIIVDNKGGAITNNGSYTTTGAVFYGDFDGNFHGDIWSNGNFKVFDNGTTTDNEDGTRARFWGDHIGDVYSQDGVNKVLETGTDSTTPSYLDVEEVYANIYAEDRSYIILDTGDANGADAFVRADVYAADGTDVAYKVLEAGATGGDAWFKGDVYTKDGLTKVVESTDAADAIVRANVTAPSGISSFNNITATGTLHVDGAITTNANTIVLADNEDSATDSSNDTDLDGAGIVVGTGTYAPSFLYDADANKWVANVGIVGDISSSLTADKWTTARTVTFANGDV
jgi:lipopolysaccharide export system protein LptA